MTRSHSTPHRDPSPGNQHDAERFWLWVYAAMIAVVVIGAIVSRQGWL